jgi:hypothetical protein
MKETVSKYIILDTADRQRYSNLVVGLGLEPPSLEKSSDYEKLLRSSNTGYLVQPN